MLGFGPEIEVIGPLELRDLVVSMAQATARSYAAAPSIAVESPTQRTARVHPRA